MGKRLDDLSRQLAGGVSRRQVLKGAVGGIAAAAVATLLPGRTAEANSACATLGCCETYCTAFFSRIVLNSTIIYQEIAQCVQECTSAAQNNQGPCAACQNCADNSLCIPANVLFLNYTVIYPPKSPPAVCVPLSSGSGNDNSQGNENN